MSGRKNPETFERTYAADDAAVTATFEVDEDTRSVRIVRLVFEGGDLPEGVDSSHLRAFPLGRAYAEAQEHAWDAQPIGASWPRGVARPDGSDDWYRAFAATFLYARARHPDAPAKSVAGDFNVPVTTVHRWTREARRRGFLPPDPRGKRTK